MRGRHWTRGEALKSPLFWFMVPAIMGPSAFNTAFFFHQVHLAEVKGCATLNWWRCSRLYTASRSAAMLVTGWVLDRIGTARLMPGRNSR